MAFIADWLGAEWTMTELAAPYAIAILKEQEPASGRRRRTRQEVATN